MSPGDLQEALTAAVQLHQAGQLAEAERLYRQVLSQAPHQPDALHMLGLIAHAAGHDGRAVELISQALNVRPNLPAAHYNLGRIFQTQQQLASAEAAYRRALEYKPDYAEAHLNLGMVLQAQGELERALASYQQALASRPDYPEAHNNRGTLLQELGRPREAVAAYRQALAIRPHYPEALHNLSEALQDLHQMRDAIATCEQALALDPEFADAHCGLAFALLREGDLKRGFEQYEWRFRRRDYLPLRRELQGPAWQGEDLKGKIVLLYVEPAQGFGDTLQFARFAPELAARGAMVLVECQPALVRLFGSLAGAAGIVSLGGHLPAFDLQASLMSLPYLLGTTLETIPASVPYLAPPADVQTRWRKRLGAGGAFRVGLVWATHPGHERRRSPRTLALDALTPLASIPRIQLFSLQKGAASLPADMGLIDLGPELGDFADTGAAIMNLDLVISVDTAVAHLAGALGRPVWTMLPFAAEWRWQLERRDSPWYPSMRLFRQPIWGDWTSVVAEVAAGLASLARS